MSFAEQTGSRTRLVQQLGGDLDRPPEQIPAASPAQALPEPSLWTILIKTLSGRRGRGAQCAQVARRWWASLGRGAAPAELRNGACVRRCAATGAQLSYAARVCIHA